MLEEKERAKLLEDLYHKYGHSKTWGQKYIYWRKKYSWLIVVQGAKFLKRGLDLVLSLSLLIVLSPLMVLIALIIKISDHGPVLYVSNRVGKWGKEFQFLKYRTMYAGADQLKKKLQSDHGKEIAFKMKNDPRVTPFGRILRKTSLDELPQLWCVFKGDMTLVGPRPPLVEEVAYYSLEERKRLDTKPGITCIWQVSGRSNIPFSGQVKLDLQYIESQSIWLDIKLLLKTIPAVLFGRGAY